MAFTVTYKRHACKFHFVNNMSNWHFACLPHYNDAWIQETGPITPEESDALAAFAGIAREYGYGPNWLGRPFVAAPTEEQALRDTEQMLGAVRVTEQPTGAAPALRNTERLSGSTHARRLRDIFATMEPRFARIWVRDEPRLISLAERLDGRLRSGGMERAAAVAERLYGAKLPDLEILLILSRGRRSVAGGANEGPGRITIAALEVDDIQPVAEVVLHESIHLLEADGFRDMYHSISMAHGLEDIRGDKFWDADHLVREAILGALVPGGALAPLMGGTVRDFASEAAQQRAAGRIGNADLLSVTGLYVPLLQEYIDAGKPIDADLVKRAIALFKEILG